MFQRAPALTPAPALPAPGSTAAPSGHVDDAIDRDLVDRVAAGDPVALERLYDRYRARAYSVALRITSDPGLAEDVIQEAFLQAWRNAGRYTSSMASVRAWLLGIVHHRAVDTMRSRRPTVELPDGEDVPTALTLPDPWPEVDQGLDRDAVHAAIEALSNVQREVIELAYFRGLSQREISIRTATPLGTVKSRARDALIALRHALVGETGLVAGRGAS